MSKKDRLSFMPVLGRAECSHFDPAQKREWLVTNGLGGFAAGTISGAHTRRYHGLLVAALNPPGERTLLVSKLDAVAHYGDRAFALFANEFGSGHASPHGYRHLESFQLDGLIPVWRFAVSDALLEQRIWMEHGRNTTVITFSLKRATAPLSLSVTPLCTYRGFHGHTRGGWSLDVHPVTGGFEVRAFEGAQPYRVVADRGQFELHPDWYWNFKHRIERYRGLDDTEDLLATGKFHIELAPGETVTFVCSTEPVEPQPGSESLRRERRRQKKLVKAARVKKEPAWVKQLVLAADQFIVQRRAGSGENGQTVVAGYPWFGDWGRDTMIALPGLALSTGRPEVAADILRTFGRFVSQGMLPNRFADEGETPEYNTVDATLWYFYAIYEYLEQTGDIGLIRDLYPALVDIIDWHQRGTRYGIRVDPADGLLFAGEPGVQLTWMDAKVGDWVVTPRIGKPVEVNALWHNALRVMAELSLQLGHADVVPQYAGQAQRVAESFNRRFWNAEGGYLYDVIDGPEGEPDADGNMVDSSLRPNQIIAVSLPFDLLDAVTARAVVDVCGRHLLTSHGLRSLAMFHLAYNGHYGGDQWQRDGAYHEGTVWGWLLGHFATAHYRVYGDAEAAKSFLQPLAQHLCDGCVGSISEIFDGNSPHTPRGCFAQAWSVSETLRAWLALK
jgi:predicted glycogen debranching enzyme